MTDNSQAFVEAVQLDKEGMPHREIARQLGFAQSTISDWLSGRREPRIDKTRRERFMAKVSPEPMSGCWLWCGATNEHGYGNFWDRGTMRKAHRVSFEMHCGEIGRGQFVLHKCDTPGCVNPGHLWLGTGKDNTADMVKKGRWRNRRKDADDPSMRNCRKTKSELLAAQKRIAKLEAALRQAGETAGEFVAVLAGEFSYKELSELEFQMLETLRANLKELLP